MMTKLMAATQIAFTFLCMLACLGKVFLRYEITLGITEADTLRVNVSKVETINGKFHLILEGFSPNNENSFMLKN